MPSDKRENDDDDKDTCVSIIVVHQRTQISQRLACLSHAVNVTTNSSSGVRTFKNERVIKTRGEGVGVGG